MRPECPHTESKIRALQGLVPDWRALPKALPYSGLAEEYDPEVGAALFPAVRAGFERLVRDFRLHFSSIADVGCGTGRFLRYLSRFSAQLWGVDSSPCMLRIAKRRLGSSGVRLFLQDMRTLKLPSRVDLVVCNGDTLNYLVAPGELVRALRSCRRNLRPGGHLVCDFLAGTPPRSRSTKHRRTSGGQMARWRCRTDPSRGLTWVEYAVAHPSSGGPRWMVELHRQRWFPVAEVLQGLTAAGLRTLAVQRLDGRRGMRRAWMQVLARAGQEGPSGI